MTKKWYAVKIGEVRLVANKPITDEDRKEALEALARIYEDRALAIVKSGARVRLAVDSH